MSNNGTVLIQQGTGELSEIERAELAQCEATVEHGRTVFIAVGNALLAIREKRLYREHYSTFEEYCHERWQISRPRAYQFMEAATVMGNLSTVVDIPPANEAQVRPLTRLAPSEQQDVWQEVVATAPNGKVTGAHVQQVVASRLEPNTLEPAPVSSSETPGGRDKPNTKNVHFSSEDEKWATPQDLFDFLNREFGFTLDVCAEPETAKCERYFTPADDGLAQEWSGVCWMNPPYGREIVKWLRKAYETALQGVGTVVCLVPARTDTQWWWNYVRHGEVRFLPGRLTFGSDAYWEGRWNDPDPENKLYGKHGKKNSAPFPSAVVVFRPGPQQPNVTWWNWKEDVDWAVDWTEVDWTEVDWTEVDCA